MKNIIIKLKEQLMWCGVYVAVSDKHPWQHIILPCNCLSVSNFSFLFSPTKFFFLSVNFTFNLTFLFLSIDFFPVTADLGCCYFLLLLLWILRQRLFSFFLFFNMFLHLGKAWFCFIWRVQWGSLCSNVFGLWEFGKRWEIDLIGGLVLCWDWSFNDLVTH